eukprot:scaffold12659_cov73-Skeletonema_dohrnii-CCMP3373.AAC.1
MITVVTCRPHSIQPPTQPTSPCSPRQFVFIMVTYAIERAELYYSLLQVFSWSMSTRGSLSVFDYARLKAEQERRARCKAAFIRFISITRF